MTFPRHARIFRSQLDVTPFAIVFFLVVMFMMLGALVYTPGVRVQLPVADDLPGTDKPTVTVAVDAKGRLYLENQLVEESDLKLRLQAAAEKSLEPLTLVVLMDKAVTFEDQMRLISLARHAGIQNWWWATLPRLVAAPDNGAPVRP